MIKGVDLSTFQRNLNYQELKDAGVEFAILRCGYGKDSGQKDEMFEEHYRGCKEVGIKVGAYLYSYCTAIENAEKEAYNCLDQIEGKDFDLPIYYDLEDAKTVGQLGKEAITEIAIRFCNVIRNAGYRAGVYANLNWFTNYIDVWELIRNNISIWLAQWNNEITANFDVDIWQNTNRNEFGFDGDYLVNENLLVENGDNSVDNQEIQSLAVDVIFGLYGNGQERKDRLGEKYNSVQDVVNEIYRIIKGE